MKLVERALQLVGKAPPPAEGAGLRIRYRTMSLRLDGDPTVATKTGRADPAVALRAISAHTFTPEEIYIRYSTHPEHGLDTVAVARKAAEGKNKISKPPTQYFLKAINYIFGGFNTLMWLAFVLTILSYKPLGGNPAPVFNLGVAMLLLIVILASAAFYAIIDWNASRIMKAVTGLVAETAVVIRDGKRETVPADHLVVGDLVELTLGQRCPADLRIISTSPDCKFDRSLLTGESDPIGATVSATSENALETRNLALMSTFLVQGSCTGIVFAIGDNSVMGRLVSMSAATKIEMTTIQKEIWFFTKIISTVSISMFGISIIAWAAWLRTSYSGFITASTAIVNSIGCITAMVPQSLPICVALSLTIIAKRMARRRVLVKNLAAIETLGCMNILCSDKTGTLTEGRMAVENIAFANGLVKAGDTSSEKPKTACAGMDSVQLVSRLCNGARFNDAAPKDGSGDQRTIIGDPTDSAILRFAQNISDTTPLVDAHETLLTIPFNSRVKRMVSVVRPQSGGAILLIKGAPDQLFDNCTSAVDTEGNEVAFDHAYWSGVQHAWAREGQRVLALCRRSLEGVKLQTGNPEVFEQQIEAAGLEDLQLVALLGLRDPPRVDVKAAVSTIRGAHVKIFMVTGDFLATAVGIARQVGIITNDRVETLEDARGSKASKESIAVSSDAEAQVLSLAVEGSELETMSASDWDILVDRYREIVFARTTPEQKLRIVEELKARRDNTVAVTGDGVNDAPALQVADIGVAMGAGSDIAQDAADIVLLNNDFASIPVAIENGRLVFENLKKVIVYLYPTGCYTEAIAVIANIFCGMQIPLSSFLQVGFCMFNDVAMSISLMHEAPEFDLMHRPPRNAKRDRLTDRNWFFHVFIWLGPQIWLCCMGMWFFWFQVNGFGFYDVILTYDKWTDGWKGRSSDELLHLVSVGQCIYYITMVFIQYGVLLSLRTRRASIFQSFPFWGPHRNKYLPISMAASAVIACIVLYGPGLQSVFSTTPIPGRHWGIPWSFALGVLAIDEARKLFIRTYPKSFLAKMAW